MKTINQLEEEEGMYMSVGGRLLEDTENLYYR